jgi:hypothetical protein
VGTAPADDDRSRLLTGGKEAPVDGQPTGATDEQGEGLGRASRRASPLRQVRGQGGVEVIGAQRARPAGHGVVGGAVQPHQPPILAGAKAIGRAAQLGATIDAGDHVHADQRSSGRAIGQAQGGEGVVQ